jgi:hypothetical protein
MPILGQRLESAPFWVRWPVKWMLLGLIVFAVCYPYPALFLRDLEHLRHLDTLPDPKEPSLLPLRVQLALLLKQKGISEQQPEKLLNTVDGFVRRQLPYSYDWDTWGVVDYVPTVGEAIRMGKEDCDGQAVLAAALLRANGIDAHLVADFRHMWVTTPFGDLMTPLGPPALASSATGTHIRWLRLVDLGDLAVGISLFPVLREAIVLFTAWLLLLPPGAGWRRASLGLFLLVEAWILLRLAGSDPRFPSYWGARWALLHVLAAVLILAKSPRKTPKDTGRSVF